MSDPSPEALVHIRQVADELRDLYGDHLPGLYNRNVDLPDIWQKHAACRGMPPAMFHPARGESLQPAVSYCETCPVRRPCLLAGLCAREKFGIWGGLSERARRALRRELQPVLDAA